MSGSADSLGWIDSHCHLHDEERPFEAASRAAKAGVGAFVLIGTDADSSRRAAALAARLDAPAWSSIGLHPHEAIHGADTLLDQLGSLDASSEPRRPGQVAAIGECGLDYFYDHSPRDEQHRAFAEQIGYANRLGLTLVVHTRDAWDDTVAILDSEGVPARTVIHCFTGGVPEARRMLDLGAYLSFSGIVTFKNAELVREAAAFAPIERILVETDAPFLAPVPHRGERNEPGYVAIVGERLASLRSLDRDELSRQTSGNTLRAFNLTT